MPKAEFDDYAKSYEQQHTANIRITGEEPAFFAEYKIRTLSEATRSDDVGEILDFGAGIGASIPFWAKYFSQARLTCLDSSQESLHLAKQRFGSKANYCHYNGDEIPFSENQYDLSFAACVFHHIPEDDHKSALMEIRRILRRNGIFALFEHNPLNPLTVHAVNTCPFDENAVLIRAGTMKERILSAGFREAQIRYCLFFPAFLAALRPLERYLGWFPIGAQYMILARK